MKMDSLFGNEIVRSYKVIPVKEGGILIKLEGYPIECIRLIVDSKHNIYDCVIREKEGHIYKVEKEINGGLLNASIKKIYKKPMCT